MRFICLALVCNFLFPVGLVAADTGDELGKPKPLAVLKPMEEVNKGEWAVFEDDSGRKRKETVVAVADTEVTVRSETLDGKGKPVTSYETIIKRDIKIEFFPLKVGEGEVKKKKPRKKPKKGAAEVEAVKPKVPPAVLEVKDVPYECMIQQMPVGQGALYLLYHKDIPVRGVVATYMDDKLVGKLVDFGWGEGGDPKAARMEKETVDFTALAAEAKDVEKLDGKAVRLVCHFGRKWYSYLIDSAPRSRFQCYKITRPGYKEPTKHLTYCYIPKSCGLYDDWTKWQKDASKFNDLGGVMIRGQAYYLKGKRNLEYPVVVIVEEAKLVADIKAEGEAAKARAEKEKNATDNPDKENVE